MVAESAAANSFKIGLLVIEILHNQHFLIFLKSHISFNFNQIEMAFSVINGKPIPNQAAEKIFQIGQVVQKLLPYFNLYVNITQ